MKLLTREEIQTKPWLGDDRERVLALFDALTQAQAERNELRTWPCEGQGCAWTLADVGEHDGGRGDEHPNEPSSGGSWFCASCWNKALGSLAKQLAASQRECAALSEINSAHVLCRGVEKRLAESQAREAELRAAFLDRAKCIKGEYGSEETDAETLDALNAALARPADDSALKTEIAKADSEGYSRGASESHRAQASAVIQGLGGGDVDGAHATSINYLQLVRRVGNERQHLRAQVARLREALAKVDEIACRSVSAAGFGDEPPEPANRDGEELAMVARAALADTSDAWLTEHDAEVRAEAAQAVLAKYENPLAGRTR